VSRGATFIGRHRKLCLYLAALFAFAIAITASFHTVAAHPGSAIPAGFNDATSTIRNYWAASVQDRNPFTLKRDALIGAPAGYDLAPATTVANGGVQTAFVWALKGAFGLVGAWNAFLFLGLIATCMAMFAFLDWLGCAFTASLFGAYVFGFSPYARERAYYGHLGLLHNWIFVLLAATLIRVQVKRSLDWAAAVGAVIGLAFYLSAYQGLLASFMALVFFVVELVRLHSERIRAAWLAAMAYLVTGLALIPMLVLYNHERSTVDAAVAHDQTEVYRYAASLSAYLVPSPRNPLFHWLRTVHPDDVAEQTLFFGYTTLALAVAAVFLLVRRNTWLRASETRQWAALSAAALVPAAFLISLPPRRTIGPVSIPLPSSVIGHLSSFWRVYSRFGLLVGFGLAVLSAAALTTLAKRRGRGWRLLGPAALVVVILELLPGNVQAFNTNARPDWVAWLSTQPRGIVATYPLDLPALNWQDNWYQRFDGDPRWGFWMYASSQAVAYSRPQALRLMAHDLGAPLTARILSTDDVRYVVVHYDFYRASERRVPRLDPAHFHLLNTFGGVRVYSVHAPRVNIAALLKAHQSDLAQLQGLAPPSLTFGQGFNAPEQYNGLPGRWMIQDGELQIDNAGPPMHLILKGVAFSNQKPRILDAEDESGRVLAHGQIGTSAKPLQLGPIPIPHGKSSLILVARPWPTALGPSDPRDASVFLTKVALHPVAVYGLPRGRLGRT
jgi:hypothetical protein